ncbi:hypothetical protein AAMO2058_000334300 [Amorphochlora amoebiformis]
MESLSKNTLEAVKSHLGGDEAKLEAKIKELKAEIGEEKMKEIERARQIFATFDSNGDGKLSLEEFRQMVFECGGRVVDITEDKVKETYNGICDNGRVTFDAFYKWFIKTTSEHPNDPISFQVLKLKTQLRAKAFQRTYQKLYAKASEMTSSLIRRPRADKYKPDKNIRGASIDVDIGTFPEAKSAVYVCTSVDKKQAKAGLQKLGTQWASARCALCLDMLLDPGEDPKTHKKAKEALQELIDKADTSILPEGFPKITLKKVEMTKRVIDDKEHNILRVAVGSKAPLQEVKEQIISMLKGNKETKFSDNPALIEGKVSVELPYSVDDIVKADKEELDFKARIRVKGNISPLLLSKSRNLLHKYGKKQKKQTSGFHAMLIFLEFFRNATVALSFQTMKEFLAWLPEKVNGKLNEENKLISAIADGAFKNPHKYMENMLGDLELKGLALSPLVRRVLVCCRNISKGFSSQLQFDDFVLSVDLRGVDFSAFI